MSEPMFKKNDSVIFNYENLSKEVVVNMVYKNMHSDHHMYVVNDGEKNIFVDEGMLTPVIKTDPTKPTIDKDKGNFGPLSVVGVNKENRSATLIINNQEFTMTSPELIACVQGLIFAYESMK